MSRRPATSTALLLGLGGLAFLIAVLSIVDMYLPRPFDGVLLDPDAPGQFRVLDVAEGSGAARAGIGRGDVIKGIANNLIKSREHAARLLDNFRPGDRLEYLIESSSEPLRTVEVVLGERRFAQTTYFIAWLLGFGFFFVGIFVLVRQPRLRTSQVFFLLCSLFLLFLVCRLRPASYSRLDTPVLTTGTMALLLLPAAFLHFFLIFPRPAPVIENLNQMAGGRGWRRALAAIYLLPAVVLVITLLMSSRQGSRLALISGTPAANWWLLAAYFLLGLLVLGSNSRRLTNPRERRGVALVLAAALFGLLPFLVVTVAFPSSLHPERFLLFGLIPLGLVPLAFAFAIVRFQLLDVQITLRKGLLYTITTAAVTGVYALGIAFFFFNSWSQNSRATSPLFLPVLFALVIVLLFEPLRRRVQGPIDRFFFAERARLQQAMVEMGEALTVQTDLQEVVRDLVERLPQILGLHFAALYLDRGSRLERVAGPRSLPAQLPRLPELQRFLPRQRQKLAPLEQIERQVEKQLEDVPEGVAELATTLTVLRQQGVEVLGELSSPRRAVGIVLLSGKSGQMALEPAELELLQGLLSHAAVALENSLLLAERTRQAELERELQIASSIQNSLLPAAVELGADWQVAAVCRPAKDVGGDFFAQLPGPADGSHAVVYGDVSGKSIPGALMMMAVHEVLYTLAMTHPRPETLLDLANRRIYQLGRRSFVALGYLAPAPDGSALRYALAGQPQPLKRGLDGQVAEIAAPEHRLPLGAFADGQYRLLEEPMAPGELMLAYSDGALEARSPSGEFFGFERLLAVVAASPPNPRRLVQRVLEELRTFSGSEEPYDDVTLLAIQRRADAKREEPR